MHKKPFVYTTRIPHHSSHSGYEQLTQYLDGAEMRVHPRYSASYGIAKWTERVFRRLSLSKWYMQDGIASEMDAIKQVMSGKVSLIHFLYGDSCIGLLPWIKPFLGVPLVLSIHAVPADLEELFHRPWLLNAIDHFILLGSNQKAYFEQHGIAPYKMTVIPHGVDLNFFRPAVKRKKEGKDVKVLMVGNWKRNFDLYVQLAQRLESLPIQFHVVTAAHHQGIFRGMSKVHCYSGISDEALRELYQHSDVLLMGLCDAVANNVILEAASCGLPIVCERVGAVPEYLSDQAAFYFSPNAVEEAEAHLMRFVLDSDAGAKIRETALNEVRAYDWSLIGQQTMQLYKDLT